ncbi:MAG TPA: ComEC/Rec2 family competence protein [Galbitalea sp.]|jgi:competence protein ComEC|nr:ComEC/Rec2 family competence protein [Galbitalea sp.]
MIDLRIVVPAGAAWLATIVLLPFPSWMLPVALVSWILAVGMLVAARATHRPILVVLGVSAAATALVATAAFAGSASRRPEELRSAHELVNATVITTQTVTHASSYFAATLARDGTQSMSVPVLVFDASPASRIEIGTTLTVSGALQATSPSDEQSYLVFGTGPARFVAPPPWYLGWANGLRAGLASAAQSLPGDGGDLLPGLAIGDTSAVSPTLNAAMKTSSLSHLTAVSGANCAVIIGLLLLVGKAFGLPRGIRVAAALAMLVGFVVLVTPQPSVVRSAIMAALVLGALASGRPVAGLPVVGVTVLAMLTLDPWIALDFGFALSVLATAGLMALSGPIARRLERWLPHWLALLVAVPLAAQLACQPVLVLLNPSLPIYGVLANTLAEPASPVATVLGLIACLVLPVAPGLGHVIAAVAWVPSAWIADVATFFAGLPGARVPWPGDLFGAILLAAVTALLLVLLLGRLSRRGRGILAAVLAIAAIAPFLVTGLSNVAGQLGRPSDWQIADCDIGQGDAMLVRSAGKVALMDTGPSEPLLKACLDELGITRINLLVLSHYDLDHVAGTPVVDSMTDRALVGPSTGKPRDIAIIQGLLDGGTRVDRVSEGLTGTLGDLRWSVLWPPSLLPEGILPGNEACVTILFEPIGACTHGCLSSMFVGDLDERAQDLMLAANPTLPRLDVIEVAHHGSADQSAAMYQRVDAAVGLIGVGLNNKYGHPAQHLLDILASVGTLPARTDTEGLVLLKPGTKPGTVAVWSEHPDSGGPGRDGPGHGGPGHGGAG